jgi:hypothetical protein
MKKVTLLLLAIIICGHLCQAQKQIKTFTNSKEIDEKRYEGIKGSPYLFDDWQIGKLIDKNDSVYNDVQLNYNGYDSDFEVLNGDKFISLDDAQFKSVSINSKEGEYIFEKNLHQKFKNKLLLVVYKGANITCFMDYSVGLTENKINGNMGATSIIRRFKYDPMHYFIINGELKSMRLTKNKLTNLLSNKKAINNFIKKNKLKLTEPLDLTKILEYYEAELS